MSFLSVKMSLLSVKIHFLFFDGILLAEIV